MPHVVTDHCTACRYTECVALCPVDCFHAADDRLYIDPDACIDCGLCVAACPYNAIWPEEAVPDFLQADIQGNYDFFRRGPGYEARRDA